MNRCVVYVDGFNLYFGLKAKGWHRFYWLDIQRLALNLLKPDQRLVRTKYFTARVGAPSDKVIRQTTFLEALATLPDLDIFFGVFQLNARTCRNCGDKIIVPNEKMTDVNIATQLIVDGFQDNYDTAILISGDSDLVGPISTVKQLLPKKRVVVAFPPERVSKRLQAVASSYFVIGRGTISRSLLPPQVTRADGFQLTQPERWK